MVKFLIPCLVSRATCLAHAVCVVCSARIACVVCSARITCVVCAVCINRIIQIVVQFISHVPYVSLASHGAHMASLSTD